MAKGRVGKIRPFVMSVTLGMLAPSAISAAPVTVPPDDIARFLDRRQACAHWMGEEPYDADRRRQIEVAIRNLRCANLERTEARLRKRYAGLRDILTRLDLDPS